MRAVVDTNVLFEGLTTLGACGAVIDAWVAGKFTPCVSVALALEYEEVLTNRLAQIRSRQALAAPQAPDADDDFVIECAFNASAPIVTRNLRDFLIAEEVLRIPVLTPESFVEMLE